MEVLEQMIFCPTSLEVDCLAALSRALVSCVRALCAVRITDFLAVIFALYLPGLLASFSHTPILPRRCT